MSQLNGRVAIVTGGVQGIGLGVSESLARAGASVVLAEAVEERIPAAVAEVEALGAQALGVQTDVARASSVDRMVRTTLERFGQIDILVNNAGAIVVKHFSDQTEADYDAVLDVNLKGVFLCCKRVVEEMRKRRTGAIVNIASVAAFHYTIAHVPYAASKAGVAALTRDLAYEVGPMGIRVNGIAPSSIETPMFNRSVPDERKADMVNAIPVRRIGQPRDIGDAVAFLVSDAAGFITGVTLPVTGGADIRCTPP